MNEFRRAAELFFFYSIVLALAAVAIAPKAAQAARERQLHGVGPEGEVVVVRLSATEPQCRSDEAAAYGTWPDGTELVGCHPQRYSVYQPMLIRWREIQDGRVVERTLEYHGLRVRLVPRAR